VAALTALAAQAGLRAGPPLAAPPMLQQEQAPLRAVDPAVHIGRLLDAKRCAAMPTHPTAPKQHANPFCLEPLLPRPPETPFAAPFWTRAVAQCPFAPRALMCERPWGCDRNPMVKPRARLGGAGACIAEMLSVF
jgi:hypothetical protein